MQVPQVNIGMGVAADISSGAIGDASHIGNSGNPAEPANVGGGAVNGTVALEMMKALGM